MIEGQNIICFANDWDSDPLSKKHIMTRLAKKNRILWVNSIGNRRPTVSTHDAKRIMKKLGDFFRGPRQVTEQIHVYSPIAIPVLSSAAARWANRKALRWSVRRICRELDFHNPITWTFEPASSDIVGTLDERAVVYHCVDEFSEFSGTDKTALLELERRLMRKANCVIVSSDRLLENKRQFNSQTFLVTHGVDVRHFRKACEPKTAVPVEIRNLRRPVIGFFGLIADWVDLQLIRFLADSRPDWNFVLLGKRTADTRPLDGAPNIHTLGPKPYDTLPNYARGFDIAILPFALSELTLAANPLKLREYLAAGLPVVATAIPEAEKLQHALHIGRDHRHFLAQLRSILDSGKTGPQISISNLMENESWDHKVEELSRIFLGVSEQATAA